MRLCHVSSLAVASLLVAAGVSQAAPVLNVNLQPSYFPGYTGAGVLPSGTFWDNRDTYQHGILGPLMYSDGTTVSPFSIYGNTGSSGPSGGSNGLLAGEEKVTSHNGKKR